MTPSELFLARVNKIPNLKVPERYIEGFQGSLDCIRFEPTASRVNGHPGFSVTACIARSQVAFTTPFTHAEAQELSPVLAEFVRAFCTGVRAELMKRVADIYIEPAGVCDDMVEWAQTEWIHLLSDGAPYTTTQRTGQLKILFEHTFVMATKQLTTSIEIHDTAFGDGKHYNTEFSKFTLPRVPVQTTLPKGTPMTESIEMIEPEATPTDGESMPAEETYGMYLRRVSGYGHEQPLDILATAMENIRYETQEVYRDGELGECHVWYTNLDFVKIHPKEEQTEALYKAFAEVLEAEVLERAKRLFPSIQSLSATLPAVRKWITSMVPSWVAGETVSGQGFGNGFMDDSILRMRVSFTVMPPLNEGDAAWLAAKTLVSRVRTTPLLQTTFHPSGDADARSEELTIVQL